jgi:hypothetical protein
LFSAGARKNNGTSQATETKHMNRRSLSCNWTGEDWRKYAKWGRGMALFYGCTALLVFALIVLTKLSSVAPNGAMDSPARSAGSQGERLNRNADVLGNTR